jgi:indole-3-glycerol phosphate synthase
LRDRAVAVPLPPSFHAALAGDAVAVIAEVKRASPSKGPIAPELDAGLQAAAYRDGGAAAVSVLTEPSRFAGSLDDLAAVAALGVPALRKDFLVDVSQVWEARAAGAAAVLLIVAALDDTALGGLLRATEEAGLDALVEVHDEQELVRATAAGARIVGVNARDLRTFEIDHDAFSRIRPAFPPGVLAVAESGITTPAAVRSARAAGADAVLVGEHLVRSSDPCAAVAELVAAGARTTSQPVSRTT